VALVQLSGMEWQADSRIRYRLLDQRRGLEFLGNPYLGEFRRHFESRISDAIATQNLARDRGGPRQLRWAARLSWIKQPE
jgi:hypothetical protein